MPRISVLIPGSHLPMETPLKRHKIPRVLETHNIPRLLESCPKIAKSENKINAHTETRRMKAYCVRATLFVVVLIVSYQTGDSTRPLLQQYYFYNNIYSLCTFTT